MFAIAWRYLAGRATAKDIGDQNKPEWPPHPDRVFQALVASWGEGGCIQQGREALEWLERQDAPSLVAPEVTDAAGCVTRAYVPVNDSNEQAWMSQKKAKFAPLIRDLAIGRDRQPRTFATVHIGDADCCLIWPKAVPTPDQRAALAALCAGVTHVGHSRSLTRMWVEEKPQTAVWEPTTYTGRPRRDLMLRVPHTGRLARLERAHAQLIAGRLARNAWPIGQWRAYIRCETISREPGSAFDSRLLIFRRVGGEGAPGLIQAPVFAHAMRAALMCAADGDPRAMPLVSGHESGGQSLQRPHVAVLPLAHVGREHADGHLLGMALALPAGLSADNEQAVYAAVVKALDPDTGALTLQAGIAGTMRLEQEDRPENTRPRALRSKTWAECSRGWGTVTPIALDRLPPRRHEDQDAWAAGQVAEACKRQELPAPREVRLLPVSPFEGAPASRSFPPLLRKPDGARRWHMHAELRFEEPVRGPLILGAGRYQGYGLCRPLPETAEL